MLHFDKRGHLVPYNLIETDWQTVAETFGWNEHRRGLLTALNTFIEVLTQQMTANPFVIWINGSFVTQKEQPDDIDLVVFLPTVDHRKHEKELRRIRQELAGLDIYFVRRIEETEPDYFLYVADQTEWMFQFTMTRPDRRTNQKYPKGFVQISFNHEQTV